MHALVSRPSERPDASVAYGGAREREPGPRAHASILTSRRAAFSCCCPWVPGLAALARDRRTAASPPIPQHDERAVVVIAPLELVEARGRGEAGLGRLLHHHERIRREPSARLRAGERLLRQAPPVGRVEKGERERRERMRRAELGRVAPEHAGDAGEPERGDVLAQQRARLRGVVDEQREGGTARERLEPERAGAGEEIEHARAGDGVAISVNEDIEQRLAQAVGGRPDRPRFRRDQRAPAQAPADDAHQRLLGRAPRRPRRFSRRASSGCPIRSGSVRRRWRAGGRLSGASALDGSRVLAVLSSPRKRGPIFQRPRCGARWVPACAGTTGFAGGSMRGPAKSAPAWAATRAPSCSRRVRVLASSIAPTASSPSWNGPNDTRIRRLTASPRCPSTFVTSRCLPSRIAKVSQTLLPWARSTVASTDP